MKIGIYTEDEGISGQLEDEFCKYGEQTGISIQVTKLAQIQQLTDVLIESPFELCFIDLESESGKYAAEYLSYYDSGCIKYLLDKDKENGLYGYKVGARDYLLKPLSHDVIYKIMGAETKASAGHTAEVKIRINGLWKSIRPEKILFVESVGHNLYFHVIGGECIKFVASFKEYHPILDVYHNFHRCHQSYMVNLDYVLEMKNDSFILANGESVNISRQYRKESRQVFTDFMIKKYYR